MGDLTPEIEHHRERFSAARDGFRSEPGYLGRLREAALEGFTTRGFPTRSDEEWRATPVRALAETPFVTMGSNGHGIDIAGVEAASCGLTGPRLVFVNGAFREELSSTAGPEGVELGSLAAQVRSEPEALEPFLGRHADPERHSFVALNQALWRDGAFVRVAPGADVPEAVQIVHIVDGPGEVGASDPRNLVLVGDGARVRIVESYVGPSGVRYWTNPVTEILGGQGSVVEHYKVQREGDAALHVATVQARVDRDGTFTSHSISLGGALVRNDLRVLLDAEGASCTLNGLYVLNGKQHEDNHTHIDHAKPHGSSRELYKGILDGEARGVFHGTVLVRQDAQKTDAHQANRNLLLSDDALVDTQPNLEIFADDVKCAHGATVGQLEEQAMFYLRSRGLDPVDARGLMIHAFAAEVLQKIPLETLRTALEGELTARLPRLPMEDGL